MPLLEVDQVSKIYQSQGRDSTRQNAVASAAVAEVSLRLKSGSTLAVVGESGAGKTTLAQLVAGLLKPSAGQIKLAGAAVVHSRRGRTGRLGRARLVQLVWQDALASLDPRQRVAAGLAEVLRVHRLEPRRQRTSRVEELLEQVGLSPELGRRFPHELSGGEAQRVAIARALAVTPRLLVCDEPAAALDLRLKLQIAELLKRLRREQGLTLLAITHDLPLARILAAETAVMYRGRLVEQGPTVELLKHPLHPYTQRLLAADPSSAAWLAAVGDELRASAARRAGGCVFVGSCPSVEAVCERRQPQLLARGEGRWAACWLPDYQMPK